MTVIQNFVQSTSLEMMPAEYRLPDFVWTAVTVLNKGHRFWRWYRRAALYSNKDNFAALLGGHAINFVCGESVLVRVAAQSLLISTRLLEGVKQQRSLFKEGKKLKSALFGHYPTPIKTPWIKHTSFPLLSPSTLYNWQVSAISLCDRLARTTEILIRIARKIFTLSMCLMDTVDAFYISPTTTNEAINESFVNILTWLDAVANKKEELLQGLTDNKVVIEKILKTSPFTYSKLYQTVESALKTTETIQHHTKQVTTFGNGILVQLGKRAINGALVVAGIQDSRISFI